MDNFQVHNIALRTLQQRCEYLQQRLKAIEEENSKLKLQKAPDSSDRLKEPSSLQKQIIILNQEKSQMAHKIQMLTNENLTLWSRLSKFLPDDFICNSAFAVSANSDNQMLKLNKSDIPADYSVESVDEISLKLFNGIVMGENEVEKQYSKMIDLKNECSVDGNTDFVTKHCDKRFSVTSLMEYVQKLKDFKQILSIQKNDLLSAITLLKKSPSLLEQKHKLKDISNCSNFNYNPQNDVNLNRTPSNFSTIQCSAKLENENPELNTYICPLCSNTFDGSFDHFYQHVSKHFDD